MTTTRFRPPRMRGAGHPDAVVVGGSSAAPGAAASETGASEPGASGAAGVALAAQAPVVLDASQRAVVALADGASAAVLGAPGSGKSTTLVEVIADRILGRGQTPESVLLLTHGRATATALRDRLAARLGVVTPGPLARSVNSVAFEVVNTARLRRGEEPARLLTGGDQDFDIAEFLAGHLEDGSGPVWPEALGPEVRSLKVFRTELRELMMRLTEHRVAPARLQQLAREQELPEWEAVADFWREYRDVLANLRPDQLDSAEFVMRAADLIQAGELPASVSALRLVVVDDLQEATASTIELLRALSASGAAVIAAGDPDAATNAFRGGDPSMLGRLGIELGLPDLVTLRLGTVHRHATALRSVVRGVTDRIGTAGTVGQREATASEEIDEAPSPVRFLHASSAAREATGIAEVLRRHRLAGGVPWSELAVIVRSGAQLPALLRGLAIADIPTRTSLGGTPLRDDRAARSLLTVLEAACGRIRIDADTAEALLTGPFGGLDRLGLRRLRLALRAEAILGGHEVRAAELVAEALRHPAALSTIDAGVARAAHRLATLLAELRTGFEEGSTIEELLWLAWERSGVAPAWRSEALGVGAVASEANRNLDGVLALFTAARNFVERQPERPASDFLEAVLDADVPEDTLAAQSAGDAVLVTTPPGVVGLEFEHVVIAGLQEGVWPNLRPRGSLLHPQRLARILRGAAPDIDARREVLHDELRMFALAVSRARRSVVLTASVDEESAPSLFFSLAPDAEELPAPSRLPSLRTLVGRLRREAADAPEEPLRRAAAAALAELAREGAPGAAPDQWQGLLEPSTDAPVYEGESVRISPSALEKLQRSALEWFIDAVAGSTGTIATGIGTLVHRAMELVDTPDRDELWRAVAERWSELDFEAEWMSEQQQRTARTLIDSLADYLGDALNAGVRVVAAEKEFALTLGEATVAGTIDRVEVSADGVVTIVDLKTGKHIVPASETPGLLQLAAYQLAYASGELDDILGAVDDLTPVPGGAKLVYPRRTTQKKSYTERHQQALDEEQLDALRTELLDLAATMNAASFADGNGEERFSPGGGWRYRIHRIRAVTSD